MKGSIALLISGLAAQQVAATWNKGASGYNTPQYNNNECSDKQNKGFDWSDLKDGQKDFDYGDFKFGGGWECANQFGKRDHLTKRSFNSKCVKNTVSKEKPAKFSCDDKKKKDGFSVKQIDVSVDHDAELEFHYKMGDGSTCKQAASCKKSGTTVKNTQCGGAKEVEVHFKGSSGKEKKEKCDIGFHKIDFDCTPGKTYTPLPPPPPPKTSSPPKSSSSSVVKSSSQSTLSTATKPVSSSSSVHSSSSSAPSKPATSSAASSSVYTPISSVPTKPATSHSGNSTVPVPTKPSSSAPGSSSVYSTVPVPSKPSSSAPGSSSVYSSVPVPSKPSSSAPVPSSSAPGSSSSAPVPSSSAPGSSSSAPVPSSSAPGSSSVYSTVPVPSKPAESSASKPGESSATKPVPSSSAPGTPSPSPSAPVYPPLSCPEVLPKCLNSWIQIDSKCKDNTDSACYCKIPDFTKNVIDCVASRATAEDASKALQYFIGICAADIPKNPGIITDCPSNIPINVAPPPPAPTQPATSATKPVGSAPVPSGSAPPAPAPPAPSAPAPEIPQTTIVVGTTSYTVPQIIFTTATPEAPAPGAPAPTPGYEPINIVPVQSIPVQAPAQTTPAVPAAPYPIPSGLSSSVRPSGVAPSGTGAVVPTAPVGFTGAASSVRFEIPAAMGAILALFAL